MESTNWLKQPLDKPLFSDLLWSRPENRRFAGKLLIIGGNLHGVAAPAAAFSAANVAGAGTIRVLLPDATQKLVGKIFPEAEFVPSTPSGSFAQTALAQLLDSATWADGVLLAGDFGRNSETAILLENFAAKYSSQLTVAGDGVDYYLHKNSVIFSRGDTLAVINFDKLQKLAGASQPHPPVKHSMNLHLLVEVLADWNAQIITNHADNFVVAGGGQISTTPAPASSSWQIELAAYAAVWWLQQPDKPFEALTTAVYDYLKN